MEGPRAGGAPSYSDLSAVYINCTLKRSPQRSNTRALADRSIHIMEENGVAVEVIRAVDHDYYGRVGGCTTFLTWNLLHLARMLKDAGGIPAQGNSRTEWDAGCRLDYENPEHRV
jgi:hypothetical protein